MRVNEKASDGKEQKEVFSVKLLKTLTAHEHGVTSLIQLSDGRLASSSLDQRTKIWGKVGGEWQLG